MVDIYLLSVDDHFGAYIPSKYPMISYAPRSEFPSFVLSLKEDFPESKLHNVVDDKISAKIKERIEADKRLKAYRVLNKACKSKNNNVK